MAVPAPAGHHPVSAMVTAPGRAIIAAQVSLASGRANMNNVTGTLPVANGGTGATTLGSGLSVDGDALNLGPLTDSDNGTAVQTDGCGIFGVTGEGFAHQDGTPTPDSPVEIEVARGRNLLSESNLEYGGINSTSGNNVTGSFVRTAEKIPIEPDKSYVFSSGYESTQILICWYDSNESFIKSDSSNLDVKIFSFSKIAPANARYMRFQIRPNGGYGAAITVAEITHPQLELGSTPTPYVPYGHVGLGVYSGKNIFDEDRWSQASNYPTSGANGYKYSETIILKPNTKYTISANTYADFHTGRYFAITIIGVGVQYIIGSASNKITEPLTFTTGSNGQINFGYKDASVLSEIRNRNIQIEEGEQPTIYEPYHLSTTPIPLPSKGFAGALPDGTKDTLEIDSAGRWEWTSATAITTQAVTDGVSGTVGTDVMSSTGEIADGATVLYEPSTPSTEHGYIDLPELPAGATVSIPELEAIGVEWWVNGAEAIAEHGRDVSRANKEQEDRIAELEAAVATLATS